MTYIKVLIGMKYSGNSDIVMVIKGLGVSSLHRSILPVTLIALSECQRAVE